MQSNRPGKLLSATAAVSLILTLVLLSGYFCTFGPRLIEIESVSIPGLPGETGEVRASWFLGVDRGTILFRQATSIHPQTGSPIHQGLDWTLRPGVPELHRAMWGFERGGAAEAYYIGPSMNVRYFTFPSWLALLPCLVAPVMWQRRYRLRNHAGFPVITKPT